MATKEALLRTTSRFVSLEGVRRGGHSHPTLHAIRGGQGEASLAELLDDPVAEAAMQADGVEAADVVALFDRLRRHFGRDEAAS